MFSYVGLDLKSNKVCLSPALPKDWRRIRFNFDFKEATYFLDVTHERIKLKVTSNKKKEVRINIYDSTISVQTHIPDEIGEWSEYSINKENRVIAPC